MMVFAIAILHRTNTQSNTTQPLNHGANTVILDRSFISISLFEHLELTKTTFNQTNKKAKQRNQTTNIAHVYSFT